MDNAPDAWELPDQAMRMAARCLPIWVLAVASLPVARAAWAAGHTRAAVRRANAALAAAPPDMKTARVELERAIEANDEAEGVAQAYCVLGELDEREGDYPRALADDRAAVAAAPSSYFGVRADRRMQWLRDRSEGNFAPLARLERVRREPSLARDPAAVEALARDADSFPAGRVRVEARLLVAEAWLGSIKRPAEAIAVLREVATDPHADPVTARLAEREIVNTLVASGDLDQAVAEASSHANRLDPRFVRRTRRLLRRRAVRAWAEGVLAVFGGLAFVAFLKAKRRGRLLDAARAVRSLAPLAALFAVFVAAAGGLLAASYETGGAGPFLWLGAAAFPLALLARAWGAVGAKSGAARAGRAALCAAAVLAAALVLMASLHPTYLEGFGL